MVPDEIQQLKTTLAGLVREQADRRALHRRQAAAIKAEAHEYMTKQVRAAERYVEHRRELGRRDAEQDEPSDGVTELDFAPEEVTEQAPPVTPQWFISQVPPTPPTPPTPPAPVMPPAPDRISPRPRPRAAEIDEDDDDAILNNRWRDE